MRHRSRPTPKRQIPEAIEEHRDTHWRREATRQIETAVAAERFIEQAGFTACLTDSRRPGPSLYIAVCGRRDAVMPRNVQKDPEASLTWTLKDEILGRGNVYLTPSWRGGRPCPRAAHGPLTFTRCGGCAGRKRSAN